MKVYELIQLLQTLDPNAYIDMATDEEVNSVNDIYYQVAEGRRSDRKKSYCLLPINNESLEDKYISFYT